MEEFRVTDDDEVLENKQSICCMSLSDWTMMDKVSLAKQYSIFAVDDEQPISDIIRPPNVDDQEPSSIATVVNAGRRPVALPFFLGKLVAVGQVQTVYCNGQVEILTAGRYGMKVYGRGIVPPATWGRRHSLTEDHICDGSFTMVRVRRGQLGLATENGKPVILNEGLHAYNSPLFAFKEFVAVDSEYIKHMSYNVIRVPKGAFAKVWEQSRAKLLPEGLHVVDNPVFLFEGLVSTRDPYINHGSIHIMQVAKGSLGLVLESSFPRLLSEGLHIYDSPTLEFKGVQSKMNAVVKHGTISRFRVQKGEVGLAWRNNEPLLIEEPGTYQVDSATFRFERVEQTTQKKVELGSRKIITVYSGEVGISYNGGRLQIMQPGRHVIEAAEHTFDDFLSTQQRSMRLRQTSKTARQQEELLVCETRDLVKIGIRADVFYRIADPEKAIMQVGRADIQELVMETSIATLTNIMRSTVLNDIAQSSLPSAISEKAAQKQQQAAQAMGKPSAPLFFDKAHDQFLAKLHDDFVERYGLEITNIRIEQFKIMDDALANSISQQAVATAETESKLRNLEGQTQIATQQQERDARLRQIQAQSDAATRKTAADAELSQAEAETRAQQVRAEAEAVRLKVKAEGEASAVRIRAEATVAEAQAEAEGTKIRAEASISEAKAEAEGIRLKAAAESERAAQLAATPLGEKLALLGVYSDVVKSSNAGVQKVVYVDPSTTQASNPFGLLTLQSLNKDLQSLQAPNK